MRVKDGNIYFTFKIHDIEFEYSASVKELIEFFVKEELDTICPTYLIGFETDEERMERWKSFNKYKESVAQEFAERVLADPYDTDKWIERNKTRIEDTCLAIAEDEFDDWYFKCDFCGRYFSKEEKADCDFYSLCECCYSDAQENFG